MRKFAKPVVVSCVLGVSGAVMLFGANAASAASPVGLGVATSFAVLGASTVTNTGPSVIHGDLGVSPGSATPGVNELPGPATVDGTQHVTDGVAANARADLSSAYVDAANRPKDASIGADLVGQTLAPGVYAGPALTLTGAVTLDGQNQTNPVFIFKASAMTTATGSTINLINGATACNVYWQIGSSATLGTNSTFVGTLMALTSISATTGATIQGRLLARNGAVTLDTNTITRPDCAIIPPSTPPAPPAPPSSTPASPSSTPASPSSTPASASTPAGATTSSQAGSGGGAGGGAGGGGGGAVGGGGAGGGAGGGGGGGGGKPGVPLRAPGTGTSTNGLPSGPSTSPAQQPPTLARTGGDNQSLTIAGLVAIVLGGSVLLLARRRIPARVKRH